MTSSETPGRAHDPVCGMAVDTQAAKYRTEYDGTTQYFCCARCQGKIHRKSHSEFDSASAFGPQRVRHRIHLPHAPRDPAQRTRQLSPLRHGPRAGNPHGDQCTESRAAGHDAALLDGRGSCGADAGAGNGWAPGRVGPAPPRIAGAIDVGAIHPRNADRLLVRLAVLRARMALGTESLAEHVQPDRAGASGRPISTVSRRHSRPAGFRLGCAARAVSSPFTTRRLP